MIWLYATKYLSHISERDSQEQITFIRKYLGQKNDLPTPDVARIDGIGQNTFVVFRANKSRITILLEQQKVDMTGCNFKGKTRRSFHGLFCGLHGLAINVDLSLGSRSQEFTGMNKIKYKGTKNEVSQYAPSAVHYGPV